MNDVDQCFEEFNNVLFSYYNECYPMRTKRVRINTTINPWITEGIKNSIKIKNKLYKKYVKKTITYGNNYRNYRNTLSKIIKKAKYLYYKIKFDGCSGDIKKTWNNINSILGKKHENVNRLFNINNTQISDEKIIAEEFNNYMAT